MSTTRCTTSTDGRWPRRRVAGAAFLLVWTWSFPCFAQAPAQHSKTTRHPLPLREVVTEDCGACHGGRLRGGLGPDLTPDRLRQQGWTVDALAQVIRHGRPDRAMPGWAGVLSEAQIKAISAGLLDGRFLTNGARK
ncbi:MAG: cytochrome c [Candidatus Dadabacteria bacterium]|nr:MAG: cytochrome c [Candidatus Dadabacteria bacterium]